METEEKNRLPKIFAVTLVLLLVLVGGIFGISYWNSPQELLIKTMPEKIAYDFGDTLKPAGLSLDVRYHSGKQKIISEGFTCSPKKLKKSGKQDIMVTYKGKSVTFCVDVIPILTDVVIKSEPEKTDYLVGRELETEGLEVEAQYNDESTKTMQDGYVCSPMELSKAGEQDICVSYEGKTAIFTVNVVEVTEISVLKKPATMVYMVGDTLQTRGMVLETKRSDGKKENIQDGFICSPTELTEAGEQKITVSYEGKSTTFIVDVKEKVAYNNMEVRCSNWASRETKSGYNSKGGLVNWCLWIEFDLTKEIRESFQPTVTASWGHVKNGEGSWEGEADFASAKSGTTYSEFGTWSAENSPNGKERFTYMIFLPDDASIEGEQFVTLKVGNTKKKISFYLSYKGSYESGSGWKISDVRY